MFILYFKRAFIWNTKQGIQKFYEGDTISRCPLNMTFFIEKINENSITGVFTYYSDNKELITESIEKFPGAKIFTEFILYCVESKSMYKINDEFQLKSHTKYIKDPVVTFSKVKRGNSGTIVILEGKNGETYELINEDFTSRKTISPACSIPFFDDYYTE